MTPAEFRSIRLRLGLSQLQLARRLGYRSLGKINEMERADKPRTIPRHLDLVMEALDAGFWPKEWQRHDAAADAGTGGEGTRRKPHDAARDANVG